MKTSEIKTGEIVRVKGVAGRCRVIEVVETEQVAKVYVLPAGRGRRPSFKTVAVENVYQN